MSATCRACVRPGGKKRSVLALALLCAHCSATGLALLLTATLAGAPALFGIGLEWVLPPFLLLGILAYMMWPAKALEHDHAVGTEP